MKDLIKKTTEQDTKNEAGGGCCDTNAGNASNGCCGTPKEKDSKSGCCK